MLKYFPDAMLFLQVFIRISIQFGGFSEQHQGSSRKIPRELFHVFAGKTSNFMSAYDVNKIFTCASVANKFVLLGFFFGVKIFFLHEYCRNRQYLSLFGLGETKTIP